jgi:CDP-diacylglycerol--glycerol-3-phosphate 3-phosphatidyltransferase
VAAWYPALLYTTGDLADYLDGYLARKTNQVTPLGEALDLEWDALGMLVAFSLAVHYGVLPVWFLALGFARYLYIFAVALRRRRGEPIHPLPPSDSRRPLAGLTMGFVSVMLWPIVPPDAAMLAGAFFFVPFAAGFLRDGLVVTGVIDAESPRYLLMRRWGKRLFTRWAPIPARLALAWTLAPGIWGKFTNFTFFVRWYDAMGFPSPNLIVAGFVVVELLGGILAVLGAAGRFAAFGLLFPVGFTIVGAGLNFQRAVSLAAVLALLIFGTGAFSLWSPEAEILRRRGASSQTE